MNYAIIDIGSNTIRLSIFEKQEDNPVALVITKKKVIGLSGYIENHSLTQEGLSILGATLREFQQICHNFQIFSIHYFSTGVLRSLKNINEVQQYIWNTLHVTIDIISGDREAMLDQLSNAHFRGFHNGILLDIGGSSTELAYFVNNQPICMTSLPFGSLSLYDQYVEDILPTKVEIQVIQEHIRHELTKLPSKCPTSIAQIIGIGGSLRSLLKLQKNLHTNINEGIVSKEFIEDFLAQCPPTTKEQTSSFVRVFPDRIHTVIPGTLIAYEVLNRLNCQEINISKYGIRDGYVLELLNKQR